MFGLALVMTLSLGAQTVRIIFVSGQAEVKRPDEPAPHPATKGESVIVGTRIVTGADGRVVLTPMPGVKSIITPNTTLLLESVSETRTSATEVTHQAVLDLKEGAVVSDLHKPEGVTYDYSIRTARGLAGARGTTFTVGINKLGIQTIVVSHGIISLNFTDGSRANLMPGQLSITKANGDTQSVKNMSELPATDQKIAQKWTETTVSAITDAVQSGIEIDPAALNNAVDAAKSLGVTLPPELQSTVDSTLKTTEPQPTTTAPTTSPTTEPTPTSTEPAPAPTEPATTTTEPTPTSDSPTGPAPGPTPTSDTSTGTVTAPTTTNTIQTTNNTIITDLIISPLDAYRALLTAAQRAIFDTLPSDIQKQLVTLNTPAITNIALSPDKETGLPLTYQDLRFHLNALAGLPPASLAFVKTLGGLPFENTPDPTEWSLAAFDRTLASWNALSQPERDLIISLGAGEAIMDVSPGYVSGLLAALTTTQQALITELGWGASLEELAGKPTSAQFFTIANGLTPVERAAVKFFGIDPGNFKNPNISPIVQSLAAAGPADQQLLRQLGVAQIMLQSSTSGGYAARITNTLAFYNALTADQQIAARALGLGYLLYTYAPNATLGTGSVTALQRVSVLAQFYTTHPALQQAIRDSGMFREPMFLESPTPFDEPLAITTLNTYLALPERTRLYLTTPDKSYNFFALAKPLSTTSSPTTSPYRTLADLNTLLGSLTAAEFGALLDMDLSKAVIETGTSDPRVANGYLGTDPQATLKATLAYYTQLDAAKKFVLRELGVIGDGNIAVIGADTDGLTRLLAAYATLPGALRAATETLDESFSNNSTYGNTASAADRSFFFPRGLDASHVIQNISFQSGGDLHVGATRYLRINGAAPLSKTFTTGNQKDLYLYAADLIDLNATTFSAGIRSIKMASATINLSNLTIPEGSVASLNSKLGLTHFGSGPIPGYVNFNNVSYGVTPLTALGDARGNIAVGTLAAPAPLPTYTPKP